MFVTTILACSVIIGGTCALRVLTLSDPAKVVILGIVFLTIAVWTHRFFKRGGRPEDQMGVREAVLHQRQSAANDKLR
jgi:hypothetical protein